MRGQRLQAHPLGAAEFPPSPIPARNSRGVGHSRQLHCQEQSPVLAARFPGCEAEGLVLSRD